MRVYRNEWIRPVIRVENHSRLSAFMLCIEDTPGAISVYRGNRELMSLWGNRSMRFFWEGHCAGRGVYTLGPILVRLRDPLGIFPASLTFDIPVSVLVYPALSVFREKTLGGLPVGNLLTKNKLYEDQSYRRSLRPYRRGDDKRRINWKSSARYMNINLHKKSNNSLLVDEYEETCTFPLVVFLNIERDTYTNEYVLPKRELYLERAIEAAAAAVQFSVQSKQAAGIIIYKKNDTLVIPPATGNILSILETLARIDTSIIENRGISLPPLQKLKSEYLRCALELPWGSRLIYIGCELDDEIYASLNTLKAKRITLEYMILDTRELPQLVDGGSKRYLIKEAGYELL